MKQTIRVEQRVIKPIYDALPPVEPLPDIVDLL